jgi:hypothetical protein
MKYDDLRPHQKKANPLTLKYRLRHYDAETALALEPYAVRRKK